MELLLIIIIIRFKIIKLCVVSHGQNFNTATPFPCKLSTQSNLIKPDQNMAREMGEKRSRRFRNEGTDL